MILVCKNCKSSFLVPSSLFAEGPRRVKCARCGESWTADKHGKSLLKTKVSKGDVEKKAKELRKIAREEAKNKKTAPLAAQTPSAQPIQQKPPALNFFSKEELKKLILWISVISAGTLVFFSLIFVIFSNQIIQTWPTSQYLYIYLGLMNPPEHNALFLRNITSIRRYQDGAMHLIINGKIYNQGDKTLVVPEITVEAVGPDDRLIKSWNIAPTQATIKSKKTISFSSAILSPKESISEVNLRFIETKKNEKEDE